MSMRAEHQLFLSDDNVTETEGPLLRACINRDEDAVLKLVERGLPIHQLNARDKTGKTSLCHICANGLRSIAELVIKTPGVDPNLADNDGNTPLIFAAQAGNAEIVTLLLHGLSGLQIDQANNHGFTALMKAAIQGRPRCAKLLLMAGGDPLIRDYGRRLCALEWAEYVGRQECAKTIGQFMLTSGIKLSDGGGAESSDRLGPMEPAAVKVPATSKWSLKEKICRRRAQSSGCVNSPLSNLDSVARMFTVPIVPCWSPPIPISSDRMKRSNDGRRMTVIPKVQITFTSKDDNYFIERPTAIKMELRRAKKKNKRTFASLEALHSDETIDYDCSDVSCGDIFKF